MCVRNVNAICKTYAMVRDDNNFLRFERPFDTIMGQIDDNDKQNVITNDFFVVSDFMIMSTEQEDRKSENLIINEIDLNVIIRITRMAEKEENQESSIVDAFKIVIDESTIHKNACVPYVSINRITKVELNNHYKPLTPGRYMIKILVQPANVPESQKNQWTLQSFTPLYVNAF